MIGAILFIVTLVGAYFIGRHLEETHFASLVRRENAARRMPTLTFRRAPADWVVKDAGLVTGSVVVSVDYFKTVAAAFRGLFGGALRELEPVMQRGRREALQRMREQTRDQGFDAVIHVRIETSPLASLYRGGGTGGVEVLAYGTALKLERSW